MIITTVELTASAHARLLHTLQVRHNVLDTRHKKALYALVEAFMNMSAGTLTGRWAFPVPTGCGKTTAVVECCAALHHARNTTLSAVVCASRIEALCTMKRDMIKAGIPEKKIGLIYATAKADTYSEPSTDENEERQFLLISHNRIANEQHLAQFNTFNGQPRSIVVYDESLIISEIEHFQVEKLTKALGGWIAQLALDVKTQPELANFSNWMNERLTVIQAAFQDFDGMTDNLLPTPCFALSIEEQVEWQSRLKQEGDTLLAEFITVQHLPLRMVRHNKTAVISYRITIPQALKSVLVLDASYPIRTLEQSDKTLRDAETLPSCVREGIKFDAIKRFDQVTLYRMAHNGGRHSVATEKGKTKRILLDAVKVIQDLPVEDEVLVFVYKDRGEKLSSATMLQRELTKAGVSVGKRIHIQTWGNETSVNTYHTCKHVILVGILHRDLTELEAQHLGQIDNISAIVSPKTLKELCLSERAHLAYQALSRGCCRTIERGEAAKMTGYLIEADADIETALLKVMPGAVWNVWKPVYATAVAHGQLLTTIKKRISEALTTLPEGTISCRTLKRLVMKGEKVASQTWKRARQCALDENHQWKQVHQLLSRAV